MLDIQALVDVLNKAGQQQRQGYHLTLGKLIEALQAAPQAAIVALDRGGHVGDLDSYRGYYEDLALEPTGEPGTVASLLTICGMARGGTFTGYKGGEYDMHDGTVLWVSSYGQSSGIAVVSTEMRDGIFTLLTRETDT